MALSRSGVSKVACPIRRGLTMALSPSRSAQGFERSFAVTIAQLGAAKARGNPPTSSCRDEDRGCAGMIRISETLHWTRLSCRAKPAHAQGTQGATPHGRLQARDLPV